MTTVPLGPIVRQATPPLPAFERHIGRVVALEPLSVGHAADLWQAARLADVSWAYLRYGPFTTQADLAAHLDRISGLEQQPFFAVIPASSGKRAATEAIFLMMHHAFALGYHRVVWRCNALNAASMRAARRFGFTYEGTWRAESIVKGRRRDTAWFSILATEWPAQQVRFDAWLDDGNFDASGVAIRGLSPNI